MIKKRNLDGALIQWIMTQTGLGPGIGEIRYVAPDTSSTSQFRTQLESMSVDSGDIYTLPSLAEVAMEGYRNDIMLVAPGTYTETAEITWDKLHSHILGLGGPCSGGDQYEPNVLIYTTTTEIGTLLNITAGNCQFHNFAVMNNGDNAANLTGVTAAAYATYFKGINFSGVMNAGQDSVVAAACLYIHTGNYNNIWEDCIIGQNVLDERTGALSGVLRFTNTGSGTPCQNGTFRRCRFLSRSEGATVAMVAIPAAYCIGRGWLFDDCHFDNFSIDHAQALNQVFYDNCNTTHDIVLKNTSRRGFSYWSSNTTHIFTCDAKPETEGGEAIAVKGSA